MKTPNSEIKFELEPLERRLLLSASSLVVESGAISMDLADRLEVSHVAEQRHFLADPLNQESPYDPTSALDITQGLPECNLWENPADSGLRGKPCLESNPKPTADATPATMTSGNVSCESACEPRAILDLSAVSLDLTIVIKADGIVTVHDSDGRGGSFPNLEMFIGGSGANTYVLEEGSFFGGTIAGGGRNILDYSSYSTGVAMDLGAGLATGLRTIPDVSAVIGGHGVDRLIGPRQDSLWTVDGPGSGMVEGVEFRDFENLSGSADNQDTFVFSESGTLRGHVDGGKGGFDSIVIGGGSYSKVTYVATGPDAGSIELGDFVMVYSGMEPITDNTIVADRVFFASGGADQIRLKDDPTAGKMTIFSDNGTFESITFNNPSGSLTIDAGAGDDTVTVESLDVAFAKPITIIGGDGSDNLVVAPSLYNPAVLGALNPDSGTATLLGRAVTYSAFEGNDQLASATNVGVGPGIHLAGESIVTATDQDWHRFEVIRADSLDVKLTFTHAAGDLNVEVYNSAGALLGSGTSLDDDELVVLSGLAPGTYFIHVYGVAGAINSYGLAVEPGASSTTTVYYVNDASRGADVYTLAAGSDGQDGLSPATPKASVQAVLASYALGPTSLVVIDTGTYGVSSVVVGLGDQGAAYAGSPFGSNYNLSGTRWELADSDFNLLYGLAFTGSGGTGLFIHGTGTFFSDGNVIRGNTFSATSSVGMRVDNGTNTLLAGNQMMGQGSVALDLNAPTSVTVRDNSVSGWTDAIQINDAATLLIENNDLSGVDRAIELNSAGTAIIRGNDVHGASDVGIFVWSSVTDVDVFDNEVFSNGTGIRSYDPDVSIYGNLVRNNVWGVYGRGILGGENWSVGQPNEIRNNTTGVYVENGDVVRYNRIHDNVTGVTGQTNFDIHHNLIYRNTGQGILLSGDNGVTVTNNTVYTPSGDGIRLQDSTQNVVLRNNILWTENGYNLYVATNSQRGFGSDYNNLFTSGTGKVVWWQKDFVDLYDWQSEGDYDNHSIGYTVLHPTLDDPQFASLVGNDFHLTPLSSTSIDAGDPSTSYSAEPVGGRVDLGAYGGTSEASASATAYIRIDSPEFHTDLEQNIGHTLFWHTFDNTQIGKKLAGTVDVDLHEVGVGKVADLGIVEAAVEQLTWTPQALGLTLDPSKRYQVRIVSVQDGSISDQSREGFSIVAVTPDFFVDDSSDTNDQFTPGAVGNNRNTGKTPNDPKATLLAVLRSYNLGPNEDGGRDTVRIDSGDYIHVRNVVISGDTVNLGDDEGITITGPDDGDSNKVARIDRANPNSGSTNIDVDQGDYVTLRHLTLTGAYAGLTVHNSSTYFTGQHLVVSGNASNGIYVFADSEFTVLDRLTSFNNSGFGIRVETAIGVLRDSVAHHNGSTGLYLINQTGVTIQNNQAYSNNGGGILVSGPAPSVSGNDAYSNLGDGLHLSGQSTVLVTGNVIHDNGGKGLYVSGSNITINPHTIYNHGGNGLEVQGGSGILIEGALVHHSGGTGIMVVGTNAVLRNSQSYNNETGVHADAGGFPSVEMLVEHNRVYDNSLRGIYAIENVRVVENTVYGHIGTGDSGIMVQYGATALHNVVYHNFIGIQGGGAYNSAKVFENRVYDNSSIGIIGYCDTDVVGNVVYSSGIGIFMDSSGSQLTGSVTNNLVYDSATVGVVLESAISGTSVINNTVYEPIADGLRLQGGSQNVAIRNNIIWVADGRGINVASDSQAGFSSDYNLLHVTGNGKIGTWQGSDLQNLLAWRNRAFTDTNSLSQNPLFIDFDGADDQLGFVDSTKDGRDDDFHLVSVAGRFSGALAPVVNLSTGLPIFLAELLVSDGVQSPAIDRGAGWDPFVNEPSPNGGFINLGAYGNTRLASKSPVEYVLVTLPDGGDVWPADQPFSIRWRSHDHNNNLLLNSGNESMLVGGEIPGWIEVAGAGWTQRQTNPDPWEGGHFFFSGSDATAELLQTVDVSAYATEIQAGIMNFAFTGFLRSGNEYVLDSARFILEYINATSDVLYTFDSGEIKSNLAWQLVADTHIAPEGTTAVRLRLVSQRYYGTTNDGYFDKLSLTPQTTVNVELLEDGNPTPVLGIAPNTGDDGEFLWSIPANTTPSSNYRIRVTRNDDISLTDISNATFELTPPISIYYVNDGSLTGDEYSTAVGSDVNDGLSPATPKASIQAVLAAYDLNPGGVILVDTGSYNVSANITIAATDAGVTVRGPVQANNAALLNRGNTSAGSYVFQLNDADGTTLEHLSMANAQTGVYVSGGSSAVIIQDNDIYGNSGQGIHIPGGSGSLIVQRNHIHGNTVHGVYVPVGGGNVRVDENVVYGNSQHGILLDTASVSVSGNQVYGNTWSGMTLTNQTGVLVQGNRVYWNGTHGISVSGSGSTASGNESYGNGGTGGYHGILMAGGGMRVLNNEVYGNEHGINVDGGGFGEATSLVDGNDAHDNRSRGIYVFENVRVTGNKVYGQDGAGDVGIQVQYEAVAEGNEVYGNTIGIQAGGGYNAGYAIGNRVYGNAESGITAYTSSDVRGNVVYSNATGIFVDASGSNYTGEVTNNLVYGNANRGLVVEEARSGVRVENNTVYQATGEVVRVQGATQNLVLRNNILWTESGGLYSVTADSQVGFDTDYNLLRVSGGGRVADWGGVEFNGRANWYYEFGYDGNSVEGDPQLVDWDGADGVMGYRVTPVGGATILDDEDAGYAAVSGTWTEYTTSGFGGDLRRSSTSGEADWLLTGLTIGATYQVSLTWAIPDIYYNNAGDARFVLYAGASALPEKELTEKRWSQQVAPVDFTSDGAGWEILGYFEVTEDTLLVRGSSGSRLVADAVRVQRVEITRGMDDNWHEPMGSVAVDKGDVQSYYLNERMPNGGRVNLGAYGNTVTAAASPAQLVQVMEPNGLEKYETGQNAPIQWRSAGLKLSQPVAIINAGGGAVDNWARDWEMLRPANSAYTVGSVTNAINRASVVDAAPEPVYQSYAYANAGAGAKLVYELDLADGLYDLRLHFEEPYLYASAGSRKFDIVVNGTTVVDDYNIFVAAGNQTFKATVVEIADVAAVGGGGLRLELVNVVSTAVISGIEVWTDTAGGIGSPTVDVQTSVDAGAVWMGVGSGVAMDRFGRGNQAWVPPNPQSNEALVRVIANQGTLSQDVSDGVFQIANGGTSYYVNVAGDIDFTDNEYTTTAGDDIHTGKTPDSPMASLRALIAAYDLDAGDVVYVDSGTYLLVGNVLLENGDAGVTIHGAEGLGHATIINRSNTNSSSYVFELDNADGVTLEYLDITGGIYGVYGVSGSDGVVIRHNRIHGNTGHGVYVPAGGGNVRVDENVVYGNSQHGITLDTVSVSVSGNQVYGNTWRGVTLTNQTGVLVQGNRVYGNGQHGISVSGSGSTASGNESYQNGGTGGYHGIHMVGAGMRVLNNKVYGNDHGINVDGSGFGETMSLVDGNDAHDNRSRGIYVVENVRVTGNKVYGQNGAGDVGIQVQYEAVAEGNDVYGNTIGIQAGGGYNAGYAFGNRVYGNGEFGITAYTSSDVRGNVVYSNTTGIFVDASGSNYTGEVTNNLVYGNADTGIVVEEARSGAAVVSNTLSQEVGNALRIQGSSQSVTIRNNIFASKLGYDIHVSTDSQTGLNSDYNLFYQGSDPSAQAGYFGGVARDLLSDWKIATNQDSHSLEGDPLFVDMNGADNVMGYVTGGAGYDGGRDDNYQLRALSPAIDRSETGWSPFVDIDGSARHDDPGSANLGTQNFIVTTFTSSLFATTGVAMNWRGDNSSWTMTLGFTFGFYGIDYTSVNVGSNGYLQFGAAANDPTNTLDKMLERIVIAPLWDNLSTSGTGDDIFVDSGTIGQVTIRWNATNQANNSDVNMAVTLFANGAIRFDYGGGNTNLTPTVGISGGKPFEGALYQRFAKPSIDGQPILTNAASIDFVLNDGGIGDLGAYEFLGSSLDTEPPVVLSVNPGGIHTQSITNAPVTQLFIEFNEPLNRIDARASANYDLRGAGPDGVFEDGNDIVYKVDAIYSSGSTTVRLDLVSGSLPSGLHRLTLRGSETTSLHDLAGLRLDGNGDASSGGDYIRLFTVNTNPVSVNDTYSTTEDTMVSRTAPGMLLNDSDIDLDTLQVIGVDLSGTFGLVTWAANGSFVYNPNGRFESLQGGQSASDSFGYTIGDGRGGQASGSATFTIAGVNDAPAPTNDAYGISEDLAFTANAANGLLGNDFDPEFDNLQIISVDLSGMIGQLTWQPDGSFHYDPNGQFESLDIGESVQETFRYTVSDGNGGRGDAIVTLSITGRNDAPAFSGTTSNTPILENGLLTLTGTFVAQDLVDTFVLRVDWRDGSPLESFPFAAEVRAFSVTHRYLDNSVPSLGYDIALTLTDDEGLMDSHTTNVVVNNVAPVAQADTAMTQSGHSVAIAVLLNDTDVLADPLSLHGVTQGLHGTVAINPDGTVIYTADLAFVGEDTFTYTIHDGDNGFATASVEVTVEPANDMPVTLSGKVTYYDGLRIVPGVTMTLGGSQTDTATTGSDGSFGFSVPQGVGEYTLTPSKSSESPPSQGVTTLDIVLIRRHILGIALLTSPYQLLAADVNNSGTVTTLDLVLIRRLILGITTSFPGGSWKFVDSEATFVNPTAPWNFDNNRSVSNPSADQSNLDFVGIKMGDVNASWRAP